MVASRAGEHDREADGGEHEDDGRIGGQLGEEIGCAAGAEGRLRTLTAEGSGEVGGFALLEEDDANDKERDDDMEDDEDIEHRSSVTTSWFRRFRSEDLISEMRFRGCVDWCGGGDLNPCALRR